MKNKDVFSEGLRCRLKDAQMEVRDGFWEKLQLDLPVATNTINFHFEKWCVAATILLILGWSSYMWLNRNEKIEQTENKSLAYQTTATFIDEENIEEMIPSITEKKPPLQTQLHYKHSPILKPQTSNFQQVTYEETNAKNTADYAQVRVRIQITQTHSSIQHATAQTHSNNYAQRMDDGDVIQTAESEVITSHPSPWMLKAFIGTILSHNGYAMPLSAGLSVERSINNLFSLETGLIYNQLEAKGNQGEECTLHTLELPIKLNAKLVEGKRANLYASISASVEKCIAGAMDNSFEAEPVQTSLNAGLGVNYKLNDSVNLFAETILSHHFDTNSQYRTIYTERNSNINLCCGVRMKL